MLSCFRSLDHNNNCPLCKQYIGHSTGECSKDLSVDNITDTLLNTLFPNESEERIRLENVEIELHK